MHNQETGGIAESVESVMDSKFPPRNRTLIFPPFINFANFISATVKLLLIDICYLLKVFKLISVSQRYILVENQ